MSALAQSQQIRRNEELVNSLTHGLGAVLSLVGLVVMVVKAAHRGDVWQIVSFSIFGTSLFILYLASTLYHSASTRERWISPPFARRFFKTFDHAAIYLLIAGSYTPFLLVTLRGAWGWSIFGVIWGLAIAGILFKCLYIERFHNASLILYLLMGWLCVVAGKQLLANLSHLSLALLVFGGLSYTLGVIFYKWHTLPYHHAVWHVFVLGGSACHYFSVLAIL